MPQKKTTVVLRISGQQCRAGRAWCQLESRDLAALIGCDRDTISRFENNADYQIRPKKEKAIRLALEARGVRFLFSPMGEPLGIEGGPTS